MNLFSFSQLRQKTIYILCLCAVTVFVTTLCFLGFKWHSDWLLAHKPVAESGQSIIDHQDKNLLARLPEAHLFGQAIVNEVPTSNLQLQVTGIVKTESGKKLNSKAYISIAGQPSKIYQTGDSLPYGVKVYAINKDAVIVENNGRLEKILLPREPLEFKAHVTKEDLSA